MSNDSIRKIDEILCRGVAANDFPGVERALKQGADGNSALKIACERRNFPMLLTLLNAGDNCDTTLYGALYVACSWRWHGLPADTEIIRVLLDYGAKVDGTENVDGESCATLLSELVSDEDVDLEPVQLLLDAGASPNSKDFEGNTPLHRCRSPLVALALLNARADIFAVNKNGKSPFEEQPAIRDAIVEHYAGSLVQQEWSRSLHTIFLQARSQHIFLTAIGKLDSDEMLLLIGLVLASESGSIRHQDSDGNLPLHLCCRTKAPLPVTKILVEQDRDSLKIENHVGRYPIHEACHRPDGTTSVDLQTIIYLVQEGGVDTLSKQDNSGNTPLHLLLKIRHPPVSAVELLFKVYPAAVSQRTVDGDLPIYLGCEHLSYLSLIYMLVRAFPQTVDRNAPHRKLIATVKATRTMAPEQY